MGNEHRDLTQVPPGLQKVGWGGKTRRMVTCALVKLHFDLGSAGVVPPL